MSSRSIVRVVCCTASLGVAAALIAAWASSAESAVPTRRTAPEPDFRNLARHAPLPMFPPDATLTTPYGIVVADVTVGPDGRVSDVQILETPGHRFAQAVRSAVLDWRFAAPVANGRAVVTRGTLTFYFGLEDGEGRVWGAGDAPYVGRWRDTRSQHAALSGRTAR